MGHGFADNYSWLYPLLWSYGVTVMDKDGKKVALDSSETAKAVEFVKQAVQGSLHRGLHRLAGSGQQQGLPDQPDLVHQQRLQHHGLGQARPADMGKVIDHAQSQGPNGQRYHALVPVTHGVFAYSNDRRPPRTSCADHGPEAVPAVDRLRRHVLRSVPARLRQVPEWDIEPRVKPFQKVLETGKLRRGRRLPTAPHGEVVNRWIVIDMFTKACTGTPTKTAIAEAVAQLKQIYA